MMELILGIALVGVAVGIGAVLNRRRSRQIARRRLGEGLEDFESSFSVDVPRDVIRAVYRYMQSYYGVPDVPIRPSDSLRETIRLGRFGGIGLDDVICDLEEELGVDIPILETDLPIETAHDLVLYVHQLQRGSRERA